MEYNTCDKILEWYKQQAQLKLPIDPLQYLEMAEKLNAMLGDETDKLIDMDLELAQIREMEMTKQGAAAKAKLAVESHPKYAEARKQKAKIDRIQETIRLAKIHSRMKSDEYRNS